MDPIFLRKAYILVKDEATNTPGTDSLPTGANAQKVRSLSITPIDGDEVEHTQIQPHFGHFHSELATSWVKVSCEVYLAGSGVPGTVPAYDVLLRACGTSETEVEDVSNTYGPISEEIPTVTMYCNVGGTNHKITYMRGDVALTTDAKGFPVLKFDMTGLFLPVVDGALPTLTYTAMARAVPVNKANTTLTLHGIALQAAAFGLQFGNQVTYDNLIGFEGVDIQDRKSTYSATFRATDMATKNWFDLAKTPTTGVLSLVHGTVAGNIVTISSARATVGKPTEGERNGIRMYTVNGRLIPSDAGNDEWSIAYS